MGGHGQFIAIHFLMGSLGMGWEALSALPADPEMDCWELKLQCIEHVHVIN